MRLFIAIQFEENIIDALTGFQEDMRAQGVTGNYSRPENLHLTLAFIGDYGNPDEVLDAMEKVDFRPFEINLDGVGNFGELFWAGISENPELKGYVKRLRRELSTCGIPYDKKRFSPHITLIRKASYRYGEQIPVSEAPKGNMTVNRISLMRSDRGKQGMIYTEIGNIMAGENKKKDIKYLIIGAGGTGGAVGAHMARAGKDVTLVARGAHLEAIQRKGLKVVKPDEEFAIAEIAACTMEEYHGHPDVILVCVKGYSVDDAIPFIRRVAHNDTIVIPILNIYGTGSRMQPNLPGILVTDGCIYIASEIRKPGVILMRANVFQVVFGVRNAAEYRPVLRTIEKDLNDSGIKGVLSDDIRRDALLKFSYVSPQSTCGLFYDVPAGEIQKPGEVRDCFISLIEEIDLLAKAMGIHFDGDIVTRNLKILDRVEPEMTTSLQRDLAAGNRSEIDGQIFEVIRLAQEYGVKLPVYEKIAGRLKSFSVGWKGENRP